MLFISHGPRVVVTSKNPIRPFHDDASKKEHIDLGEPCSYGAQPSSKACCHALIAKRFGRVEAHMRQVGIHCKMFSHCFGVQIGLTV